MRNCSNAPAHISSVIKDLVGGMDKTKKAIPTKDDILFVWKKAAGEQAAKHSAPASLKNKTLVVSVDSTVWIYQLRLEEQHLIKKMAKLLKDKAIEKIRFRAGL